MTRRSSSWILLALSWMLMGLWACDCGDGKPPCLCGADDACEVDTDCADGVSCVDSCCGGCKDCLTDTDCDDDTLECVDGVCVDKVACDNPCVVGADCGACEACVDSCCESSECASDADCPPENDLPRYCPTEPDPETGCQECLFVRCEEDSECEDPAFPLYVECTASQYPRCVRGMCECAQPCGGACPDGTYCCQATNNCDPIPDPCPDLKCEDCLMQNPDPGGSLNEETCAWQDVTCSCVPLPPLDPAFAGQHSALALLPDGVPVLSGYYGRPYGDLLFGMASGAATGATVDWTFVDGVPADAPCEGDANGPRNGIAEPGDDVGWDTDIVVEDSSLIRISYHDRTNGALKYAVSADGLFWTVHTVDDNGLTGRYSSMAVGPDGRPMIAYMTLNDSGQSMLKLAWANDGVTDPQADTDWTFYELDSMAMPCTPDSCDVGSVCLESFGACAVEDDAANCNAGDGCADGEACVAGACEVLMTGSALDDLPDGVGLFASLALFDDGSPAVAYYVNSSNPELRFASWTGSAFGAPAVLDTGRGIDCDMFIDGSDQIHVTYQDPALGELWYVNAGVSAPELVDVGARDVDGNPTDAASAVGAFHWVGNFPRVVADSSARVRVAYQDGTTEDLLHGTRAPDGTWNLEIVARKEIAENFVGAYGFFVDMVLTADEDSLISNFKHNLRTEPFSSAIDLRLFTP